MIILHRTGRYSLFAYVFILMLQVAVVTGQNKKGGVTVSYESGFGSSRVARFTNANSFPGRVEVSYHGTKMHGSDEASGADAVFVAATYFAALRGHGVSFASVRFRAVKLSD